MRMSAPLLSVTLDPERSCSLAARHNTTCSPLDSRMRFLAIGVAALAAVAAAERHVVPSEANEEELERARRLDLGSALDQVTSAVGAGISAVCTVYTVCSGASSGHESFQKKSCDCMPSRSVWNARGLVAESGGMQGRPLVHVGA